LGAYRAMKRGGREGKEKGNGEKSVKKKGRVRRRKLAFQRGKGGGFIHVND